MSRTTCSNRAPTACGKGCPPAAAKGRRSVRWFALSSRLPFGLGKGGHQLIQILRADPGLREVRRGEARSHERAAVLDLRAEAADKIFGDPVDGGAAVMILAVHPLHAQTAAPYRAVDLD